MFPLARTIFGLAVGWLIARLVGLLARLHVAPSPEAKRTTRRSFVRNAALGAAGVVVVEAIAGFIFFFYPNKTGAFGGEIPVPQDQIPEVGAPPVTVNEGKFHLVHAEEGLLALYWKCVHLGCTVPWIQDQGEFHCPCHGSVYNYVGERLSGPAPRPLDYMAVNVLDTGDIVVDTGDIRTRLDYEPEQAVPYPAV